MGKFFARLYMRITLNKKKFIAYSILRTLVILTAVRSIFTHNYESFALCILSLLLFLLPSFFEETLKIEIPAMFQIFIYLFIYAAEILGEVSNYYTMFPGWDTMLHTINGFLCAAIGLSLFNILNRGSKSVHLSPFYLVFMAFCFSMTVGVLWEFFEYGADHFLKLDMQKDFVVSAFSSVNLDETNSQIPVRVDGITETIIETSDGKNYVIEGGYLDIGIKDTMKDLFVNFIGAIVFSIIGFFYEWKHKEKSLAKDLMIQPLSDEEMKEMDDEIDNRLNEVRQIAKEKGKIKAKKNKTF